MCGDQVSDPTNHVALKFCDATGNQAESAVFSKVAIPQGAKVTGLGNFLCPESQNASYCRFAYQPQGVSSCSTAVALRCTVWEARLIQGLMQLRAAGARDLGPFSLLRG
jgi:hypothetical protein